MLRLALAAFLVATVSLPSGADGQRVSGFARRSAEGTLHTATYEGDVDGDGKPDRLRLDRRGERGYLIARLTRFGRQEVPVEPLNVSLFDIPGLPRILAVVDVDNTGEREIFIQSGQGATTTIFTIIRLQYGRLTPVMLDGNPVELADSASAMHGGTIGCDGGKLLDAAWGGDPDCAGEKTCFRGEIVAYSLDGARLVVAGRRSIRLEPDPDNGVPDREQLQAAGLLPPACEEVGHLRQFVPTKK